MSVRKRQSGKVESKDPSLFTTVSKALSPNASWSEKDEFLDVVYWLRQILGVLIGVVWGVIPLKGIIGLLLFFAVNVAVVYMYSNSFQKIDEDEYGGVMEVLKEGLMTSFATFLVTWIVLYSAIHFN